MSELLSPEPEQEPSIMSIPEQRNGEPAEIIDFEKSSAELVTAAFLHDLQSSIEGGESGMELAAHIEKSLTPRAVEEPDPLNERLVGLIETADAFRDADLYDQKAEHDIIFQRLIGILQSTLKDHDLRDHRRAALKLTELRGTVSDQTKQDELWGQVIDSLFSHTSQPR